MSTLIETTAVAVQQEQPVLFEVAILDSKEPVRLTPELIREKSKALTDLVILDIFDDAGFEAVKKAKAKAVKTRTAIERIEKEHTGALKKAYDAKKLEVTTYTASLYEACREVENNLQEKLTTIEDAKAEAARKLNDAREAKTTLRENKMYELGMAWNGQNFVGYGKVIGKPFLFDLSEESYELLTTELEGLQVSGKESGPVVQAAPPAIAGSGWGNISDQQKGNAEYSAQSFKPFENIIYHNGLIIGGLKISFIITNGTVEESPYERAIANDEIGQSKYFVQVITR